MKRTKLIGQGGYGCVFKPSIPCDITKDSDPKLVSKLLTDENAHLEMIELDRINEIDSEYKYHIKAEEICKYNPEYNKYVKNLEQCNVVQKNGLDELSLLQYKNGGISLYDFLQKKTNYLKNKYEVISMIQNLENLFFGLKEMNINGYGHFDIKTPNIVIDPDTFKMNYIDFGLASDYSKVFEKLTNPDYNVDNSIFLNFYYVYPFEVVLLLKKTLLGFNKNMNFSIEVMKKNFNESKYENLIKRLDNFYYNKIKYYPFQSILINGSKSQIIFKNFIFKNFIMYDNYEEIFTKIISKIDTFSFGITLIHILNFITKSIDENNIKFKNELEFTSIKKTIYFLIMTMVKSNNEKRINAVNAYNYFKNNILSKLLVLEKNEKFILRETGTDLEPERKSIFGYITSIFNGQGAAAGAGNFV
jgi:serine/threonine protein kinase